MPQEQFCDFKAYNAHIIFHFPGSMILGIDKSGAISERILWKKSRLAYILYNVECVSPSNLVVAPGRQLVLVTER